MFAFDYTQSHDNGSYLISTDKSKTNEWIIRNNIRIHMALSVVCLDCLNTMRIQSQSINEVFFSNFILITKSYHTSSVISITNEIATIRCNWSTGFNTYYSLYFQFCFEYVSKKIQTHIAQWADIKATYNHTAYSVFVRTSSRNRQCADFADFL